MSSTSFEFLYQKENTKSCNGPTSGDQSPFSNNDTPPSKISISTQTKSIEPPSTEDFCHALITRPLSGVDRLLYRRKNRLTEIRAKTLEPAGAIPEVKLPGWRNVNLGDKIPSRHVPHHRIIFSRGKICQNIRKNSLSNILEDPCDNELILRSMYDALHDPNAKSYFQNPTVQRQLLAQGLITPNGEVTCSLTEFNKWRAYLNRRISIEQIKQSLNQMNVTREANYAQMKRFEDFELQESIRNRQSRRHERLLNARETKMKRHLETIARYEQAQEVKHERMFCFKLHLARMHVDRCTRAKEAVHKRNYQLAQFRKDSLYIRDRLIQQILKKQSVSEKRKENETQRKVARTERHFVKSLQVRCQLEKVEKKREMYVTEVMEKEIRAATETRQQNVERQWKHLKNKTKIRRVDTTEEWKKNLARKAFQKWIHFTNNRKSMRNLNPNTSVFNISTILGNTISSITKIIGHEDSSIKTPSSTKVIPTSVYLTKSIKSLRSRDHPDYQKIKAVTSEFIMNKESKSCPRSRSERFFSKKQVPCKHIARVHSVERTAKLFDETMAILISENRAKCRTQKPIGRDEEGTSTEKVVTTNGERGDSSRIKGTKSAGLNLKSQSSSDMKLQHAIIHDLIALPSDFEKFESSSTGSAFEGYKIPTPSTSLWSLLTLPESESEKSSEQQRHLQDEIGDETEYLYNIARQAQARVAMTSASVASVLSKSSSDSDIEVKLDEFTGVIQNEIDKDKTGKLKHNFVKTLVKLCVGRKMMNFERKGCQHEYPGLDSRN